MDEASLEQIELLAQRIIIHMTHFTKPEFREHIDDEDSWIGSIDTISKTLPAFLELYVEVCSDENLAIMDEEGNEVLRRGFFRSMVDTSAMHLSIIDKILKDNDLDLFLDRVASIARQLHRGIDGIMKRKMTMMDLARTSNNRSCSVREVEKLGEGLAELSREFRKLNKSLSASIKTMEDIVRQIRKVLRRTVRRRDKQRKSG